MKTAKPWRIWLCAIIATCVVVAALWHGARRDTGGSVPSRPSQSASSSIDEQEQGVAAAGADGGAMATNEETGVAFGTDAGPSSDGSAPRSQIEPIANVGPLPTWTRHFPDAKEIEERFEEDGPDLRLRQAMLETRDPRQPYVLWQERQERDAGGDWIVAGYAAFTGDGFLIETEEVDVEGEAFQELLRENSLRVDYVSKSAGFARVKLDVAGILALERAVDAVRSALPTTMVDKEVLYFPTATPNDWRTDYQWALHNIVAQDAWEFTTGSEEVVVAVLDTGLDMDHPDITENLFVNPGEIAGNGIDDDRDAAIHQDELIDDVSGWDFFDDDADPNDSGGHGTHVSGLVGARGNNGLGTVGVNWNVKILPLRVGTASNLETGAIRKALAYVESLKKRGINVVATNNSYGSDEYDSFTYSAIKRQEDSGILFVAAAGNDGVDMDRGGALSYPAAYDLDNIISVANSNQSDDLSATSNTGATSVDLSAPGTEVYSTYPAGGYQFLSGTSMASPIVAGAVALLASSEPELTAAQLKKRILDTVDVIPSHAGKSVTGGRLNLLRALRPELTDHRLAARGLDESIIIVDDPSLPVDFQLEALDQATLTAAILEGGATATLTPLDETGYRFVATDEGAYQIRFAAEVSGIERVIEKWIFVGQFDDVTTGLSHRYDFDGSGASEPDLAGGADGVYTDGQKTESDFGRVAEFAGSGSKMEFQGSFSSKITIAALVKNQDFASNPHPRIVNMPFYYLYFSSDSPLNPADGNRDTLKFFAEKSISFGVWNSPPRSVRENEWMYVVGTYDSGSAASVPSLYINGRKVPVWVQQRPSGSQRNTGGSSYLGNNGDSDRAWTGLMGGVRIYDRELNQREVAALGAVLAEKKWNRFTVAAREPVAVGEEARFWLRDFDGVAALGEYQWSVLSQEGQYELISADSSEARIRFLDEGSYTVVARVSDGVSIRFFSYTFNPQSSAPVSGTYTGLTDGGGMIWVQVDGSLATGRVTVMDPATGYYRIREPVVIDEQGVFFSAEGSVGRMEGDLAGGLDGEVSGYGIAFSGQRETPASVGSAYEGIYEGGSVGRAGERIFLEVSDNGLGYFTREGERADLGVGTVTESGALVLETLSGASVALSFDSAGETVSGSIQEAGLETQVYLENVDYASPLGLRGGVVASAVPKSGQLGMFASFVGVGEEMGVGLAAGDFSSPQASAVDSEAILAIDASSRHFGMSRGGGESLLSELGYRIDRGMVDLSDKAVRSILAQLNVGPRGGAGIGFAIAGEVPQEILVRGLGPAFAQSALTDPRLELLIRSADGWRTIASNDDWMDGQAFESGGQSSQGPHKALAEASELLELAPLGDGGKDASMRVWLSPGLYLLRVTASDGDEGEGLLEVHEIP